MDASLLFDPAEMVDMIERGETLPDRWQVVAETVALLSGVGVGFAGQALEASGFTPFVPELCSLEVCAAIVEGTVKAVLYDTGPIALGVTIH